MSTLTANMQFSLSVNEVFSAAECPSAGDRTLVHNQFNELVSFSASSTPPISQVFAKQYTGTQNLDLTALVKDIGGTIDCTGLKVQAILLNNLSTTDELIVSDGGANPYSLNGGDDKEVPPGGRWQEYFADQLADVDATHLAIDITPAAGEQFQIIMIFG